MVQATSTNLTNQDGHSEGCDCSLCCKLPLPVDTLLPSSSPETASIVPISFNTAFNLSSNPNANHTIYLDFDGHTTVNTLWNSFYRKTTISTSAFDFDGNKSSFSAAELDRIYYIWQRVAEDFAPFNVNVTTQQPDVNDLIKTNGGTDTRWGVRVAIGGSSYDWLGAGAGGVAYVDSFSWNTDIPVFVFDDQLGNGNEKYTAEAISHEVGHSLGLSHDGRTTPKEGYYTGHGSGETGWAPILGIGYYQNLTQWSKGEYAGADNLQDDLQIITTRNGFTYRVDDAGNTVATAKSLTVVGGTSLSGSGLIEQNTDVDFHSFTTGTGLINLSITPFTRGPNLDILAELYNSAGTLITSSNPTEALSASISATVAAGTYYLKIDGTGKGNAKSTGYSDYGSLGQYSITGSIPTNIVSVPTISVSDVSITEGNSETKNAVFTVSLSSPATQTTYVDWITAPGTATAGQDYLTTRSRLILYTGRQSRTISIPIIGDTISEANESFFLNLSRPVNAIIGDNQGIGTIINDDLITI